VAAKLDIAGFDIGAAVAGADVLAVAAPSASTGVTPSKQAASRNSAVDIGVAVIVLPI
jgi:hypothetical protein